MAGVGGLISLGERPPSAKEKKKKVLSIKMCVDRKLSAIIPCHPSSFANGSVLGRIKLAFCVAFHQNQWGPYGSNRMLLPDQPSTEKNKQGTIY